MPIELIIALIVFGLLTVAGAVIYCVEGYKQYSNENIWIKVLYYIYHIVLGCPYLFAYIVERIIENKNNKTHKAVKVL